MIFQPVLYTRFMQELTYKKVYRNINLTKDGGGGGFKGFRISFSPVASTNVGISPSKLYDF